MQFEEGSQPAVAQYMYSARATKYEESWHPQYTDRFMSLVDIKPGDRVLSLACGTGLEIDIAAPQVGADGLVMGVDVTADMLDVAKEKLARNPTYASRIRLVQHDITDLGTCKEVERELSIGSSVPMHSSSSMTRLLSCGSGQNIFDREASWLSTSLMSSASVKVFS